MFDWQHESLTNSYKMIMIQQNVQRNEAIRYLEFCVGTLNVKDRTIHNYLMSLYAKNVPEKLEPYLNSYGQVSYKEWSTTFQRKIARSIG